MKSKLPPALIRNVPVPVQADPKPIGPIDAMVTEISNLTAELHSTLETVECVFNPVLNPPPATCGDGTAEKAAQDPKCQMLVSLEHIAAGLREAINRLHRINGRSQL